MMMRLYTEISSWLVWGQILFILSQDLNIHFLVSSDHEVLLDVGLKRGTGSCWKILSNLPTALFVYVSFDL